MSNASSKFKCGLFLGLIALLGASAAVAQQATKPANYPSRAIEFVVPFGVGGGVDALCRALAPLLEKRLGVAVAVVNKPGGNSVVALNYVVSQPPTATRSPA